MANPIQYCKVKKKFFFNFLKVGLKLNIQKTKVMASGPISLRQIDEETVETVSNFIFLGFKITEDGNCNHENKRQSLEGQL